MELEHEFTVPVPVDQAWPVLLDVERIAPCMPGATLDSVDGDEFTGRLKVKLGAMTITYRGSARIASRDESAHTVTIEGTGKEARGAGTASATVQAHLHDEGDNTRVTVHTKLNVTGRPAQFGRNILSEVGGKLVGRFADNLAEEIGREPTPAEPGSAETPQVAPAESTIGGTGEPEAVAAAEPQVAPASPAAGDGTPEAVAAASAEPTAADGTPQAPETTPRQAAPVAGRPAARSFDDDAIDLLEFAGPSIAKRIAPVLAGLIVLWLITRILRRRRG
jgi:carbon monoxide dehydrogenase subunit G